MSSTTKTRRAAKAGLLATAGLERLIGDLFCGAGGSSTGARKALKRLGLKMKLVAVNHNPTAIETHSRNHPDAFHIREDIDEVDPREAVPGGKLDLLMASPTCTYHSRARGGKPVSWDQRKGRMTPRAVLRWLRALDVNVLLLENVPEFVEWGPLDRTTGKPRRDKRGRHFRWFARQVERLGYTVQWRILNAADYGDATTRSRLFLIARKDGKPITWPTPTHAKNPEAGDLFTSPRKRWRAAREVIDWKLRGASIFRRKKPLAAKTLRRIAGGLERFGWAPIFREVLARHMAGEDVSRFLCRCEGAATPAFTMQVNQGDGRNRNLRDAGEPLPTVVCRPSFGVVLRQHADAGRDLELPAPAITAGGNHLGVVEPFVMRSGMHKSNAACVRRAGEPLPTVTTDGGLGVIEPFVLSQASGGAPRSTEEPAPTIPTDGAHALITSYYGTGGCQEAAQPLPTVTTRDRFGVVVPVTPEPFLTDAFGERPGQAARVRSIHEPTPTLCAQGRIPLVEGACRACGGVDILFRMLTPEELAGAMGFNDDETTYEFAGNKTERTRQIGNAVPVNMAAALVGAIFS